MIYLDHNATTPILAEVADGMMPYLREEWGNPSSSYGFGAKLKRQLEVARASVAELVGARYPSEIIFTSGGTEANNTAINAAVLSQPEKRHLVTSVVEHSSVLSYCRFLEKFHEYRVTYLPVDREGMISLADLENAISDETAVVSLMWANNETGVLFPVEEAAAICETRQVLFHCDAVQTAGKLPINLAENSFSYLSVSAHKIGGSKGIGALYVRKKAPYAPLLHGGHQERGRRGGTENLPNVVGFGIAAKHALGEVGRFSKRVGELRDSFEAEIMRSIPGAELNGHPSLRLANTTNVTFPGIESEALLLLLDHAGICASSGSACLADSPDPSHVVAAMKPGDSAQHCVRFSLGTENTFDEMSEVTRALGRIIPTLQMK